MSTALHFDVSTFSSHSQKFVFVLAWSGKKMGIFNLWVFRDVYVLVDFVRLPERVQPFFGHHWSAFFANVKV